MHRYQITTSKRADPPGTDSLQRAFARAAIDWAHVVTGVDVSVSDGGFVIGMDVVGSPARARTECERLFAAAWYDAFGSRGNTHVGWLTEETLAV